MKRALITGITGQDGSYLAEFLLDKGYEVHGIVRRSSSFNTGRIEHLVKSELFGKRFFYHWGDLTDASNIGAVVSEVDPHEIYNLGAQSHVKVSFEVPEQTANINALGAMRLLDAVKTYCPEARVYQASTSEMYGGLLPKVPEDGYDENSPFHPRSPYGVAKVYAYWITRNYREAYDLYACNGILFNHESPRRGETFVTRKITRWFGQHFRELLNGRCSRPLQLGNLGAVRDWGHAKDCVRAQWMILQQQLPEDYVVATGQTHSVRQFVEACFDWLGMQVTWDGQGTSEQGFVTLGGTSTPVVEVNPRYFRPAEVAYLKGNASKIRSIGWEPEYGFDELVDDMMCADCGVASRAELGVGRGA